MSGPSKLKHRFRFKVNITGKESSSFSVVFGSYGIYALECSWIKDKSLEAAFRTISKQLKSSGKVLKRIFPDSPITKKPTEVRMGKGKGSHDHFGFPLKPGRIIFELPFVSKTQAEQLLTAAINKLGVKCGLLTREVGSLN